jgi:predicted permease
MWFRKKTEDDRLDKELRYHFEKLVRDSIAEGMDPAEARRLAQLEFGGMEQIKEECRDVKGRWLDDLGKDLRYAIRTLRRSPGFLAVAVLSLALGVGANTAIFSLINAVMLQTLPVKDPSTLVHLTRLMPNGRPGVLSYPHFLYFRDNMRSISGVAAERSQDATIVMDGMEEQVTGELVSGDHYSVLGMEPAAGRLLVAGDDTTTGEAPAAVISYRYWQRRFGGSASAIGKTFAIRERVFTIVGVTPPRYQGTRLGRDPDITIPLSMMMNEEQRREATSNTLAVMGRLKPGVSLAEANAEFQVLWQSFLKAQAALAAEKERAGILNQSAAVLEASDGFNAIRYTFSEPLMVLMAIVGMVLLLACANLSGLLLARAASRQREISIRLAIGASAGRLMRQFLAESFVLAVFGGGLGLLLAYWFSGTLVQMMANGSTLVLSTAPDWRVLAFTGVVSLLACVVAGTAPGLHALRVNLNPGLKQMRHGHPRLGKAFVVAQLSISMVLLVGATLFVGTLVKLYSVDRGLQTDGVLLFGVGSNTRYAQARSWAVQSEILERLSTVSGVASASAAQVVPIGGGLWTRGIQVEGYTFRPDEKEDTGFNVIAPKYFGTLGTPLLEGREFTALDTDTAPKVAVVNESFAKYFFADRSPLGRHVTSVGVTYEIVGVVKDAKYQSLRDGVMKTMYIPWTQREGDQPANYSFLARVASGNPLRLTAVIERMLREADPALRLRAPRTYSEVVDRSIVRERMLATVAGFFGILAVIVAALGIFGVIAFQVSRRVSELGLRLALGASRSGILLLILREVVGMAVIGSAIGGVMSLAVTGVARKMLFGLTPTQPGVFVVAACVLSAAALAAGWVPARRAARVDPMVALRHD